MQREPIFLPRVGRITIVAPVIQVNDAVSNSSGSNAVDVWG